MRCGSRGRGGRAVLALLAGLLAGGWVGGGLVWVFHRTAIREAGGAVGEVALGAADELDLVPADAAGFAHIRAADLWKTDAMTEYRRVLGKAGDDALKALDDGFVPAPSTLDRVTVVLLPPARRPLDPPNRPKQPFEFKGGFQPEFAPPPPPRSEPDVVALLTFGTPFDFEKVRVANLPKGQKQVVGTGELWSDDTAGVALSPVSDRTLVVGPVAAVRAFRTKAKTADGPLAPALRLAAAGNRHVVGAVNLKAQPLPPDFARDLPPEAGAVFKADALAFGMVVGRGLKLDLRAGYENDASAEEAEKALRKAVEAGRKSLGEAKAKMKELVTGKPGAPKPRTVDQLPEAVGGLFALGAVSVADEFLARDPLKRTGPEVSAEVTMDSVGGAYTAASAMSIGLLLPAVQKVREAAGRAQDANNLKQIAIALHSYHDVYNRFPAAGLTARPNDRTGTPLLSWRVAILPYVGEVGLYEQFKMDEPWDGPNNRKLIERMPKVFATPRAPAAPGKTHYQVFVSDENARPRTMFGRTVGRPIAGVVDGLTNTFMVVEATNSVDWTKPEDLTFDPRGNAFPQLGLPGADGFNVVMGDGSVRYVRRGVPQQTLEAYIGINDGEVVPPLP